MSDSPLAPRLLFGESFMPLVDMSQWAVVGLFFKAMMLPPAYLSLSKGESLTFLLQEVLSYSFMATAMILGFRYGGMSGLGIGILLSGMFDCLSVWAISLLRYSFRYSLRVVRLFITQLPLLVAMLITVRLCSGINYILLGALITLLSTAYSLRFLQRHTNLVHRITSKLKISH